MKRTKLLFIFLISFLYVGAQINRGRNFYTSEMINVIYAAEDADYIYENKGSSIIKGHENLKLRSTEKGGFFSYKTDLKRNDLANIFIIGYVTDGKVDKGKKEVFNIIVNGRLIHTEQLRIKKSGFHEISYLLPESILKERKEIIVKFESYDENSVIPDIYSIILAGSDKYRTLYMEN